MLGYAFVQFVKEGAQEGGATRIGGTLGEKWYQVGQATENEPTENENINFLLVWGAEPHSVLINMPVYR